MEPTTGKPTSQSPILWVLLVLLVGAAAGAGGYFLGKNDTADKVATDTPVTNSQQSVQEFCSQGYCINYDNNKWKFESTITADVKELGDVVTLTNNTNSEVKANFATFLELGGECENCYAYPVEMIAHPNVKDYFIAKILFYTRSADRTIQNVKAGIYVVDKANIATYKFAVGEETRAQNVLTRAGTFKANNKSQGWLYYENARTFQTLEPAKNSLEMDENESEREAYEILASLHKQAQQ